MDVYQLPKKMETRIESPTNYFYLLPCFLPLLMLVQLPDRKGWSNAGPRNRSDRPSRGPSRRPRRVHGPSARLEQCRGGRGCNQAAEAGTPRHAAPPPRHATPSRLANHSGAVRWGGRAAKRISPPPPRRGPPRLCVPLHVALFAAVRHYRTASATRSKGALPLHVSDKSCFPVGNADLQFSEESDVRKI